VSHKEQKKIINQIIDELGLKKQADLAELLGVTVQTVKHWSASNTKIPTWFFKFVECLKKNRDN